MVKSMPLWGWPMILLAATALAMATWWGLLVLALVTWMLLVSI